VSAKPQRLYAFNSLLSQRLKTYLLVIAAGNEDNFLLKTLQSRGHKAYLVGGCVRDFILSVQPNDWDICTSALPEAVLEIFPESRTDGIKHGTVAVLMGSHTVEVTTFRSEGSYTDHRHPEDVSFVADLNTDLRRRDFTMNAMALPVDGYLTDPFGGVKDIQDKLVRCVGEPELRFEEDALRMFRAMRFSARLGFEIEEKTFEAIKTKAHLARDLSAERVREEVEKILLTQGAETVFTMMDIGLMDAVRAIEAAFSEVHYFPVSAMGHAANGEEYEPEHVTEPFYWLIQRTDPVLANVMGINKDNANA